jgi:hypothetical protein
VGKRQRITRGSDSGRRADDMKKKGAAEEIAARKAPKHQ